MENLTGTQGSTHEEEGNMGRRVKVSELRKGMRVATERSGWRYEATVLQAESPERGGVSSWTVYADNDGNPGGLHCYHSDTEFEVLEEAPLPPEPGVGSTVEVDEVLFNHVDDDCIGWRGANEGATSPGATCTSWVKSRCCSTLPALSPSSRLAINLPRCPRMARAMRATCSMFAARVLTTWCTPTAAGDGVSIWIRPRPGMPSPTCAPSVR